MPSGFRRRRTSGTPALAASPALNRLKSFRLLSVIASLATAIATTVVLLGQPAGADTAGVPPNIVDYNQVPIEDWPAVQRFEVQAARKVLTNHGLPEADYNAVRGWARNEVRSQLWLDLVAVIKKESADRTEDEQHVYHWFQTVMQQSNIEAAEASRAEYLKWSGLSIDNYTTADPVNYNHADPSHANGGYCVYRAPEPYIDEYTGHTHQSCYTADSVPGSFLAPSPTYEDFVKYGAYVANAAHVRKPNLGLAAGEVAASVAVAVAASAAGVVVPAALALAAGTTVLAMPAAIFPHAAYAGAVVGAGTVGGLAGLVTIVVMAVVVTIIASIAIDTQLTMGKKIADLVSKARDSLPDLHGQLEADEFRATDQSHPWTDEQRKPRFYPGMFSPFILATLPEPTPEPCSSGIVVGGDIYNPGCINQPKPAAIAPSDQFFSVTPKDSTATTVQRSITAFDPVARASKTSRLSGKGWFVQREDVTSSATQSLSINYVDWDGNFKRAQRFWDETNGYRFAVTPMMHPEMATFTDTLQVLQYDQTKVSVKTVAPPVDQVAGISDVTINLPEPAYNNVDNAFSVTATGTASYGWWFPGLSSESFILNQPAGVPSGYSLVAGSSVTRTFQDLRPTDVFLQIGVAGETMIKKFTINVVDGRATDQITVAPVNDVPVGRSQPLTLTTTSGVGVFSDGPPTETCSLGVNGIGVVSGVQALHAGLCTVRLKTWGNADYKPAQVDVSFNVLKAEQTITLEPVHEMTVGQTQVVAATTSSSLTPVVEVNGGTFYCSVSGNVVTARNIGPCHLLVLQPGNDDYLPSRMLSATINITKGSQTISFATLSQRQIGHQQLLTASASSGLDVSLAVDASAASICHLSTTSDGTPIAVADAVGTCSVTASQAGNANYEAATPVTRTFPVNRITQQISFATLIDLAAGSSQNLTASAGSGLGVTVTVDPSSVGICSVDAAMTKVTAIIGGTCDLTAAQAGNEIYAAAEPVHRSFEISKAGQSITFDELNDLRFNESQPLSAHATSGLPVTLAVVTGSTCTIDGDSVIANGVGDCTITASQDGNAGHLAATPVTRSFAITKAAQAITVDPLTDLSFGQTQKLSARTSSGLGVLVTVAAGSQTVCRYEAPLLEAIGVGDCELTVAQPGDNNHLAATPVLAEFTVTPRPVTITAQGQTIVYGQTPAPVGYNVSVAAAYVTGVECAADSVVGVGSYAITCSGGRVSPGYEITKYVPAELKVTRARATVHVDPETVQHSDPLPNLDVLGSTGGLIGTDTLVGTLSGCTAPDLAVSDGRVDSPAGSYPLTGCTGLSNPNYIVSYSGAVDVSREKASLTYTGGWYFSTGTGSTATVDMAVDIGQEQDGSPGDLTRSKVDFLLFKPTNLSSVPDYSVTGVTVSASGVATASVPTLAENTYHLVVRLSPGNGFFTASEEPTEVTVWKPVTGTSAAGGGQVLDQADANGRAHFGFSVSYNKKVGPRGQLSFSWRNRVNGFDYVVRSNSWSGGAFIVKGTEATMVAKANLTVIDPLTGLVMSHLSGGNYQLKVVAKDNGTGGQTDTYGVTVTNPQGSAIHTVAVTVIRGGNVTIHS